jgi:hypothetical protein
VTTRHQRRKAQLLQISKDRRLTGYVPPVGLVNAAQERTTDMVEYFRLAVMDVDWKIEWDYLERLAQSCYLQGATDTAEVAARMKIGERL